jgi:hypothetical protein
MVNGVSSAWHNIPPTACVPNIHHKGEYCPIPIQRAIYIYDQNNIAHPELKTKLLCNTMEGYCMSGITALKCFSTIPRNTVLLVKNVDNLTLLPPAGRM